MDSQIIAESTAAVLSCKGFQYLGIRELIFHVPGNLVDKYYFLSSTRQNPVISGLPEKPIRFQYSDVGDNGPGMAKSVLNDTSRSLCSKKYQRNMIRTFTS